MLQGPDASWVQGRNGECKQRWSHMFRLYSTPLGKAEASCKVRPGLLEMNCSSLSGRKANRKILASLRRREDCNVRASITEPVMVAA